MAGYVLVATRYVELGATIASAAANILPQIKMPSGYAFGITAGSAENPDSFEAYKFQVWADQGPSLGSQQQQQGQIPISDAAAAANQAPLNDNRPLPYQASEAQFQGLQNKIQALSQSVDKLERQLSMMETNAESRHREVTRALTSQDVINHAKAQSDKIDHIDRVMNGFQEQFLTLRSAVKDSHESLSESLPRHIGSGMSSDSLLFRAAFPTFPLSTISSPQSHRNISMPSSYSQLTRFFPFQSSPPMLLAWG